MRKIRVAFDPHLANINQAYQAYFSKDKEIEWTLLSKPRWSEKPKLLVAIRAIFFLMKTFWEFASGKYDIIHINGANLGIAAYLASFFGARYIYTIHGSPHPDLERGEGCFKSFLAAFGLFLMKFVVRRAVGVYTITRFSKMELKRDFGVDADVIYNGINAGKMHRAPCDSLRKEYQLESKEVFISVGRMIPIKQPFDVVSVFSHLKTMHPNAYLIFIGDGVLWDETVQRVHEQNLDSDVLFLKSVPFDEMREWYSCASYFISGCEMEGFGLAALEAASCGCIPILPNSGSFPEIFVRPEFLYDKKKLAQYVPPKPTEELSSYLSSVVKRFSWDNALQDYRDVYRKLAR